MTNGVPGVLLFCDEDGLRPVRPHLPPGALRAIVASSLRPTSHEPLREAACESRVPFLIQPSGARESEGWLSSLAALEADFIVVSSYSLKLPPSVVALARRAAVNVHASLLPRYRGANPIQHAIINGESTTGVTMHHVTDRIDAGPIVAQRQVPVLFEDTWLTVRERLAHATSAMVAETLPALLCGEAVAVAQNESEATRYRRRTPDDGRIDWNNSAEDIYNLIRALVAPLPGAFYESEGRRVILDRFLPLAEVEALKSRLQRLRS